jgi:monoamine oxidase
MGTKKDDDFYGIQGGMDQLTKGLVDQCKQAGVDLKDKHKVTTIKRLANDLFEVSGDDFSYTPQRVIIATTRGEYPMFDVLKHTPMLKQLAMSPLTRIYAVYPPNPATGKAWFSDKKLVLEDPLRYIIPINQESGLIMISYTDGDDTKVWNKLDGKDLQDAIQDDLKRLFPDTTIPDPTYLKKHEWIYGCTYWLPAKSPGHYEPHRAMLEAQNPSQNLYVCGESVSLVQAWMEGALESADLLATQIAKNRSAM